MQIKLFTIPISNLQENNEELNKFLRTHKIIDVDKHLVQTGTTYSWCFCVSYIENDYRKEQSGNRTKIDYMKVLDTETFAKFSKLRKIRKQIAAENAVSAYIVFTDAELAEIAKLSELSLSQLKSIKGIGDKKAEKYGEQMIKIFNETENETERESDTGNSLF